MIVAIIQARMGSSRLPGKALADINGKPAIWHIYHRLSHAKLVDKVVVATSEGSDCDPIADFCIKERIDFFRGDEDDLLDRLYKTAKKFNADTVIRVTGDCPLVDPQVVDKVIEYYKGGCFDFVSNNQVPSYPHGLDVEVFSFRILEEAWKHINDPELRALATFCLYYNNPKNKIGNVKNDEDLSKIRITLDYPEDLVLIREIFKRLSLKKDVFLLEDIVKLIKEHPELNKINEKRKTHHRLKDCESFLNAK